MPDSPSSRHLLWDRDHVWHPFTQMKDWIATDPIMLRSGKGSYLTDIHGRRYLDANSSIWTNLHGHAHPSLDLAIKRQLKKVAHVSALGLGNEPAAELAYRLVQACARIDSTRSPIPNRQVHPLQKAASQSLSKVFYSDDGSTAVEAGLKMAYEYARRILGAKSPRFLSVNGAYHGDTIGAVSLGHIDLFHRAYKGLLFKSEQTMAPYCYRCPFNKAKPERTDARLYRKCHWECVNKVEQQFERAKKTGKPFHLFATEPLIQGAAGMIAHPSGWLSKVCDIARSHRCLLLFDEVMTGFGRTGVGTLNNEENTLFAFQQEKVTPDILALAKGLTGGYLPMAATLTTQSIFDAFLGRYDEFKTFFHGHSYTANPLGAAVSIASLNLLESSVQTRHRATLESHLSSELARLFQLPWIGDIRQVGLIAGIELVKDWKLRTTFDLKERIGFRVCEAMSRRGVLTRPIGSVIVIMPPYSTTPKQISKMISVLTDSIAEILRPKK